MEASLYQNFRIGRMMETCKIETKREVKICFYYVNLSTVGVSSEVTSMSKGDT